MKLEDLSSNKGTYVGLRLLNPANAQLYAHCQAINLPVKKSLFDNRLHSTLIYSRRECPNLVADPETVHTAEFSGYTIFKGQKGENVLVVLLNAPSIIARHVQLMAEHNAAYDHPVYKPHVTLCYNFPEPTIAGIPSFDFPLHFGNEYVEELDLSWGK